MCDCGLARQVLAKTFICAYLTGIYLTGMYLTGVYLTSVYLMGVYLTGVDLILLDDKCDPFPLPPNLWAL
jgi:uncharacterized protein YjbI with pentapeptide repeats